MLRGWRTGATQIPEDNVLQFMTQLIQQGGVADLSATNHFQVTAQSPAAMALNVASGRAFLKTSTGSVYPVIDDGLTQQTVTVTANSSGLTRIDSVVLYMNPSATPNADGSGVWVETVVAGTAGSGNAPSASDITTAIGSSSPYIVLANITVGNGVSSITSGNIADQRSGVVFGIGVVQATASYGQVTTDTDGATITLNCTPSTSFSNAGNRHQVTLGGNRSLQLTGYQSGQVVTADLIQDGTGSRTITQWPQLAVSGVTMTIAAPAVVTLGKDIPTGTPIVFTTTGALPTGVTAGTTYYWIRVSATTGNLATSYANAIAGTTITTSGSQSGTHTGSIQVRWPSQTAPTLSTGKYAEDTIIFYVKDATNFNVKGYTGAQGF